MATMNVSLPDAMKAWVEQQTQTGQYSNASDYVRDLIRRDQDRQERSLDQQLRAAAREGLESEVVSDFDPEAFLAQKQR